MLVIRRAQAQAADARRHHVAGVVADQEQRRPRRLADNAKGGGSEGDSSECDVTIHSILIVIPAKREIQGQNATHSWVPAFAGRRATYCNCMPVSDPRSFLKSLLDTAIAAAAPATALPPHLPAPPKGRTVVVGAGKAAAAMAPAVEAHWPGRSRAWWSPATATASRAGASR